SPIPGPFRRARRLAGARRDLDRLARPFVPAARLAERADLGIRDPAAVPARTHDLDRPPLGWKRPAGRADARGVQPLDPDDARARPGADRAHTGVAVVRR